MFSGKSLEIFRTYDNYMRQGKKAMCFAPNIIGESRSKTGLKSPCVLFNGGSDLGVIVARRYPLDCVLIDEAQFITKDHVFQLMYIVDIHEIPVIAYGLKSNFQGELFEGSYWLLVYADKIEEVKTICYFCNKKATMVLRIEDGKPTYQGPVIQVKQEGVLDYLPVCRFHYMKPDISTIERMIERDF